MGSLEGITISRLTTLPSHQQEQAIDMLAQEFYGDQAKPQGIRVFEDSLTSHKQEAMCALIGDQTLAGVGTYKIHPFRQIESQLYLNAQYSTNGHLKALRLRRFKDLIEEQAPHDKAGELAYVVVNPAFRGRSIGGQLFAERLRLISEEGALPFTIARGTLTQPGINQRLTEYLLEQELIQNGSNADGSVNVQGVWVDQQNISSALSVTLDSMTYRSGAPQTVHLAEKHGFKARGFSRNLSPVWSKP
jgi:ribosomal protein S18 acetylase RimI-like enzyme